MAKAPADATGLDSVLPHLDGVRQEGDGFKALCPVHDDTDPSLHISVADDGKLLIHCFGCQANGSIVMRALGLPLSALNNSVGGADAAKPSGVEPVANETVRYQYTDAEGNRTFDVVRYGHGPGKTSRMRRPDAVSGSVDGIERSLYRLPEVVAAVEAQRAIHVVEGEADVDGLAACGLVATCNPMGAGKWDDKYSESLEGASVVVLPDNDDPGKKHAEEVTRSVRTVAKSVKVVELPGLPPKGDVSDWLEQGGTVEELQKLVDEMPEWRPASPIPHLQPVNFATLKGELSDAGEWLVEPVIPTQRSVSIVAKGGVGKSLLAQEIAAAVSTGRPVLNRGPDQPIHVVYIDMEMTPADLDERLTDLGYDYTNDQILQEHLHYYQHADFAPFDTDKGGQELRQVALYHDAALVIIDTLARVVEGKENDADTYINFDHRTGRLLEAAGIAVLRLDHEGKSKKKGARGSSAKRDDVDVEWAMSATGNRRYHLKLTKGRSAWLPRQVPMQQENDPLRHVIPTSQLTPPQHKLMTKLDELDVSPDLGRRQARELLRKAAFGFTQADWGPVQAARRARSAK